MKKEESKGVLNWWLQLTAPPGSVNYTVARTHAEREYLRRANLTSKIAPFIFFTPLLLLQQAHTNEGTEYSIVAIMMATLIALVFNRLGMQKIAAFILIIGIECIIELAILTASGGLGTGWLLSFDLFVVPLIMVAVLLSRHYILAFIVIHIAFILGDFYLMAHSRDLILLTAEWNGDAVAWARPIVIQILAGMLSYIAVQSTDQAIERANKAEEVAALEHAFAEERNQLQQAALELREVHARVANGYYKTRAQVPQGNVLWEVAKSLNVLLVRLERAWLAEGRLLQTEDEIRRLVCAIDDAREGHFAFWPEKTGSSVDSLLDRLRPSQQNIAPVPGKARQQQLLRRTRLKKADNSE